MSNYFKSNSVHTAHSTPMSGTGPSGFDRERYNGFRVSELKRYAREYIQYGTDRTEFVKFFRTEAKVPEHVLVRVCNEVGLK